MYRYMISYTFPIDGGFSYGNCEVRRPKPISTMDDVHDVTREIKDHYGLTNPFLLGFSRFIDTPPPRQAS